MERKVSANCPDLLVMVMVMLPLTVMGLSGGNLTVMQLSGQENARHRPCKSDMSDDEWSAMEY